MFAFKCREILTKIPPKLRMTMKTLLLKRPKRIFILMMTLLILGALALSPLIVGVGMMTLIEGFSGGNLNESNSIWGVLPWASFFTMAFFLPAIGIVILISGVCILRDIIFLMSGKSNSGNEDLNGDFGDDTLNERVKEDFNDFTL
jgi:hypothetical protein